MAQTKKASNSNKKQTKTKASAKKTETKKAATKKAPAKKASTASSASKKKVTAKKPKTVAKTVKKTNTSAKATKKASAKKSTPKKTPKKTVRKTAPKAKKPAMQPPVTKVTKAVNEIQDNLTLFMSKPNNQTMEMMMTQGTTQFEQFAKGFAEQFGDFNREGVDAVMKSGSIFAKGVEEIVKTSMALAQDAAEKQANFAKQAMSVKTLNEWAEVQNKFAQTNFDDFMSGATKLSELSVKVLSEATEPLNKQMTEAVQKATQAVAA